MAGVESAPMSDDLTQRFLRYVGVDTQSDETSNTFPSTPGQLVLLEMLKHELNELGAADVQMTKHGYVMASVPANTRKARVPTVAFLAMWIRRRTAPARTLNLSCTGNIMGESLSSRITLAYSGSCNVTGASIGCGQRHCYRQRHHVARFRRQVRCGGGRDAGGEIAPGNQAETRVGSSLLHTR